MLPIEENRYCKGCHDNVTKTMYCHCGDNYLSKEGTYSESELPDNQQTPNPMIKIGEFRTKAEHTHTVWGESFELGRPYQEKIQLVVHDENGTYEQFGFLPLIHYSEKNDVRVEVFANKNPDLWKYTFFLRCKCQELKS